MAEKRKPRGLGRGLGALIPEAVELPGLSTEPSETPQESAKTPTGIHAPVAPSSAAPEASRASERRGSSSDNRTGGDSDATVKTSRRRAGRPVDFFFQPSGGEEGEVSSSGIDLDRLRVPKNKSVTRKKSTADSVLSGAGVSKESAPAQTAAGLSDVPRETSPDSSEDGLMPVEGARYAEIPLDSIRPNSKQPRSVFEEEAMAELVQSIREIGVLQPIVVRPDSTGEAQFELVMGERRWRASREAGQTTVPAIIKGTQDMDLLRDALLENLHRSQLNPLEEAAAYQQLLEEFNCTQEELSQRIGRSRPQISNTIRLLKLPTIVQLKVAAGTISQGHARALLSLDDPAASVELAQRIINEGLSVRSTEEIAAQSTGARKTTRKKAEPSPRHERLDTIATGLADRLDTSVKISLGAKKGKMTIEFASVEDLNRIVDLLGGQ